MKKPILLILILCLNIVLAEAQIDTNAIQINSSGDVLLRNYSSGDTTWKKAMITSFLPFSTTAILKINYNNEYSGGVKIFGVTELEGLTINSLSTSRIGFSTHDVLQYGGSSYANYGLTRTGNTIGVSGFAGVNFFSDQLLRMKIAQNGNVGIGTSNPDERLTVKGKIHAQEVKIDMSVPSPDYVFQSYFDGSSKLNPNYSMLTLSQLEQFIKTNYHLPSVPSAKEIKETGLKLGAMNFALLQKIEELTLYIIEQNKRIEALELKLEKDK